MDAENIKQMEDKEVFGLLENMNYRYIAEQELHDRGYSNEEIKEEEG